MGLDPVTFLGLMKTRLLMPPRKVIIKVGGRRRIVIYALRDIAASEELTYDYKFEREKDDEERLPCLCGAPNCKGFLN
ncbi:CBM_collapsed_G0026390.mRNA.1.CDS.1 [Saccharomyces cerevisiae]|nr:CBM_collapsed_G0026390.mRNA.1.CDS.1 [Saccharomyces cerevisiae]